MANILQVPVFLFSQQENGTRKWIQYEPKCVSAINHDFHPRMEQLQSEPNTVRTRIVRPRQTSSVHDPLVYSLTLVSRVCGVDWRVSRACARITSWASDRVTPVCINVYARFNQVTIQFPNYAGNIHSGVVSLLYALSLFAGCTRVHPPTMKVHLNNKLRYVIHPQKASGSFLL